ncbi:hypothetical protein IPF37_01370 [bacterium]|nr:MAG: hypothetical protein IPF37_01370 [bacterium]
MQHLLHTFKKRSATTARVLVACFSFNMLLVTAVQAAQAEEATKIASNSSYSHLASLHLPSMAKQEMAEKKAAQEIAEHNKKIDLKDKKQLKDIKVQEMGDVEKMKYIYQILSFKANDKPASVISDNVHNDLETYCGSRTNPEHNLLKALNNTRTSVGSVELQRMLYEATNDINELKRRQDIVKALVEDQALFNQIDAKLETYKAAEKDFLWLWKEMDDEVSKYFDQAYFGKKFFIDFSGYNKNEALLQASGTWTLANPGIQVIQPILLTYLMYKMVNGLFYGKLFSTPGSQAEFEREFGRENGANSYKWFLKCCHKVFIQPLYKGHIDYEIGGYKRTEEVGAGQRVFSALMLSLYMYQYYRSVNAAVNDATTFNNVSNDIHRRMNSAAVITNTVGEIAQLVNRNETLKQELSANLQAVKNAYTFSAGNTRTASLLSTLRADTFKTEPSMLAFKGRAMAAFKEIFDVKDNLIGSIRSVGEIDAFMSVAKLYKKFANHDNVNFCFVDYVTSKTPYLNIEGFWHPVLNPNKAVPNSISLGHGNDPKNAVVTGPNAGGKSTALKSITVCVMLAQSFGIAPARSMTMTPFALVNTYMNIADTEGKESLFQAEMHRAQELLRQVRSLRNDQFSFVIMDEIFTGTNPKEGQAAAYGIAKKLATYNNSLAILATHFIVMTDLASDTVEDKAPNGKFENFKVYIERDEYNTITFPYKLEKGITDQAIALDLLQSEGFDDDILQDAFDVMNNKTQAQSERIASKK